MVVGYASVSTPEQNLKSQIDLLKNAGCDKIYSDIASGTRDDRRGLNEMLKYMRKGDTIPKDYFDLLLTIAKYDTIGAIQVKEIKTQ